MIPTYIHIGQALYKNEKYDDALSAFNNALKIETKTQKKGSLTSTMADIALSIAKC